ncbi:hypothetical protein CRBSH125_31860 [Afipia carboxidovorans]|nr:hypothetical protein CRBSH125_31860 [Afipia carboxidovorans]
MAHVGEEFRFGLVRFLGAAFFLGVFLREVGQFARLPLKCRLRAFEIDDISGEPQIVVDEALLVMLDLGDVGADRHEAAVLGAPFADVQPASVVELRLEGPRARRRDIATRNPCADFRHVADVDHRLIGCAGDHRRIRQLVQPLEVRVAQHQSVFRIPQHERFRNGLDRVAQPQVGFDLALRKAFLLGDVERDADQVAAVGTGLGEFAAHAQPDPVAVGVAHAEGLIDVVDLAREKLVRDRH